MLTVQEFQEFVKAFKLYKNILGEAFPPPQSGTRPIHVPYQWHSAKYHGFAHYEYHLDFAARTAYDREHHNIMIDWGIIDDRLLTQIVAGRKKTFCAHADTRLEEGFDIGVNGTPTERYECRNFLSARREQKFVTSALAQEVANGYLAGPHDSLPFDFYHVSPIRVATGKCPGKI